MKSTMEMQMNARYLVGKGGGTQQACEGALLISYTLSLIGHVSAVKRCPGLI